ncbi:MAG: murein biosynthesis integral membrane protein MurJ [Chloroflexota bacterium]
MTVEQPATQPAGDEDGTTAARQGVMTGTRAAGAVGAAALILMTANLSGSILGYIRGAVIGAVFGQNRAGTDAFAAASIIPQMFYDLTIGAAVSAALIPIFSEVYDRSGRKALANLSGAVFALALPLLVVVAALLVVFAHPIMSGILLQRHANPAGVDQAARIVQYMIPSLLFLGSSAILLATLYSTRRFTVSAFAAGFYHIGIMAGALLLARPLGILALPIGALAGAAAQALFQVPTLIRHIGVPRIRIVLSPEIRRILRLYAPVAAGLIVSLIGQTIDLGFKWKLHSGAVYAMSQATILTQFPIGIAVAGLSFAILPSLSADASFGRLTEFKDTLSLGIRVALFLTIPAAAGYLLLANPIAALLFEHGKTSAVGALRISEALRGYAIQIPFVGLDQLLIFAFYARKNTVTPMLIGVLGVFIYVGSALLLLPRLHIFGLALANTIQNSIHGVILLVLLLLSIGSLQGRGLGLSLLRVSAATLAMVATAALVAWGADQVVHSARLAGELARAALPILVALAMYVGVSARLRSEELRLLNELVRRKLGSAVRQ